MFDFAWSEIALIGVVALVLIGPKDMPVAIRAVAGVVKKARRMAAEFQGHVDEMVRDTELAEVRQQINEIRNFDFRGEFERAVDGDGSLKKAFEDPFTAPPPAPVVELPTPAPDPAVPDPAGPVSAPEEAAPQGPLLAAAAPAFIPPAVAATAAAPAFIPPAAQGGQPRLPFA
jgi:sec-independent protein translocase protein TatB